jgi:phosphatidylinositol-3-phosphatase
MLSKQQKLAALAGGFAALATGGLLLAKYSGAKNPSSTAASIPNNLTNAVVIWLENQTYDANFATGFPFLSSLGNYMAVAGNYHAITHDSLPNYVAMISGSTYGLNDTAPNTLYRGTDPCTGRLSSVQLPLSGKHIGDLVPSWKAYAENYATYTFPNAGDSTGLFLARHVPFLYFQDIVSPSVSTKIVDYASASVGFWADIAAGRQPVLSFITPNICDDAHTPSACVSGNQGTAPYYADTWVKNFFTQWAALGNSGSNTSLPSAVWQRTAIFVVFDESGDSTCPPTGDQVPCFVFAPNARGGLASQNLYNHYNLLSTLEAIARVGNLGQGDVRAAPMGDLFGPYTQSATGSQQLGFLDPAVNQARMAKLYFQDLSQLVYGAAPGQMAFGGTNLWTFATSNNSAYPSATYKTGAQWGVKATPNVMVTGTIYAAPIDGCNSGSNPSNWNPSGGDGDLDIELVLDEPYASNNTGNYFDGTSGGYLMPANQGLNEYPATMPILHCEIPWALQAANGGPIPCPVYSTWMNKHVLFVGDYYLDVQHPVTTQFGYGLGYWAEMHPVRYVKFL